MDSSHWGPILSSILDILNLRSNIMNVCFICFIKQGNVNWAQWGEVTYSGCPIYYTTGPGNEFSSDCHQGAALSSKKDRQEYSLSIWEPAKWTKIQNECNFLEIPSRHLRSDNSAETTVLLTLWIDLPLYHAIPPREPYSLPSASKS